LATRISSRASTCSRPSTPRWIERAAFPGRHGELVVNGERVRAAAELRPPGRSVSVVRVVVAPGTNAKVEVPGAAADAEKR